MRAEQRRSASEICNFYRQQLRKFNTLGIGKQTEWGVVITQGLIDTTNKRLEQLTIRKINL